MAKSREMEFVMEKKVLQRLPGWVKRMDEVAGNFSNPGFHGLVDYSAGTNLLGECLTNGVIPPLELHAWILEQIANYSAKDRMNAPMQSLYADPKKFWEEAWSKILREEVNLPAFPKLKLKTKQAMERFELIPVFLLEPNQYSVMSGTFYPIPGHLQKYADMELGELPGCWMLVETIQVPKGSQEFFNALGTDPLARELDLTTRFGQSWDEFEVEKFPLIAKQFGLPNKAVRFLTAKEWNLLSGLFWWLYGTFEQKFPLTDMGHEITSTRCTKFKQWITIGSSDHARRVGCGVQSVQAVDKTWRGDKSRIGWRVIATLSAPVKK